MTKPPLPPHGRKLGLCGVALTAARNPRDDVKALGEVRYELEQVVVNSGYLDGATFSWVTVAIRFGVKDEAEPHYQRISRKYGDLPLAIEITTAKIQHAPLPQLKMLFKRDDTSAWLHQQRYILIPEVRRHASLLADTFVPNTAHHSNHGTGFPKCPIQGLWLLLSGYLQSSSVYARKHDLRGRHHY